MVRGVLTKVARNGHKKCSHKLVDNGFRKRPSENGGKENGGKRFFVVLI